MSRIVRVADLFCGAGGATTGVYQAARVLGISLETVAINHWSVAVETHQRNHPMAAHLCMSVEAVDPRAVVPSGRLDLLIAGVECTHHSNARGGRPMNDQSRASAWNVIRWCELLRVDHVLLENVPEWLSWGPLGANGRPLKRQKGSTYRAFVRALESLGYAVETRILNAADYGDATTRKRLFLQAKRGRGGIVWPEPTHSRRGASTLLRHTAPWRPAREVIDWSLPSQSIRDRTRPLAPNTLKRIQAGLAKFGARPFVLQQQSGGAPRLTSEPIPTIATKGAVSLVEPFLVPFYGERDGQAPRTHAVTEPLPTLPASPKFGLIVQVTHGGRLRSVHEPLPTIPAGHRGEMALVEPFLVSLRGTDDEQIKRSSRSLDDPLPTVSAGGTHHAIVEPFTMPYCSNGGALARPVSQPLGTVTTRDRFALVIPDGMDVRFRMLQPHELAAAMGFPSGYSFAGTKTDAVRQIGNAWACRTAEALCLAIFRAQASRQREAVA